MKRSLLAVAATALIAATSAHAQSEGWGFGMMDGYGGGPGWHGMMGTGMMGPGMGFGPDYSSLKLSDEQREKVLSIERAASNKRWELMSKMRDERLRIHENYALGKLDDEALRKNYDAMSEVRKAMFEVSLQARKDVDALLTPEQRSQLGRGRGRRQ